MLVRSEIEIDATPEAVWLVLMDPSQLENWVTIHRQLGDTSPLPLRVGSTIEQTLHLGGMNAHVRWTITEFEAPRYARWLGHGPAHTKAETTYRLSASEQGSTKFEYTNDFHLPGGPLGALAGRLVSGKSEHEAERSLRKLKVLIES